LSYYEGMSLTAIASHLTEQFSPNVSFQNYAAIRNFINHTNLRIGVRNRMIPALTKNVIELIEAFRNAQDLGNNVQHYDEDLLKPNVTVIVDAIMASDRSFIQHPDRPAPTPTDRFAYQLCQRVHQLTNEAC
jgi:hypothetical protein